MPLDEEGAKWSWYDNSISISNVPRLTDPSEPCIRGHRSSKCQHFDRLMMKVPKAGRPLAKCPHPKGTCSCQKTYAVMVRIPKGISLSPAIRPHESLCANLPQVRLACVGHFMRFPWMVMNPLDLPHHRRLQLRHRLLGKCKSPEEDRAPCKQRHRTLREH